MVRELISWIALDSSFAAITGKVCLISQWFTWEINAEAKMKYHNYYYNKYSIFNTIAMQNVYRGGGYLDIFLFVISCIHLPRIADTLSVGCWDKFNRTQECLQGTVIIASRVDVLLSGSVAYKALPSGLAQHMETDHKSTWHLTTNSGVL